MPWPSDAAELEELQRWLANQRPRGWAPSADVTTGGCFVCFSRGGSGPGSMGEPAWGGAAVTRWRRILSRGSITGRAGWAYEAGLLALREGPLLEAAVRCLDQMPEVLLVNATGLDHPRRAGLALHLGWVLGVPTIGVTHRPLLASGSLPGPASGARAPLWLEGEQVGWWCRTRTGTRAVAISPGWRTDLETSLLALQASLVRARTPEPLREARRLARTARGEAERTG